MKQNDLTLFTEINYFVNYIVVLSARNRALINLLPLWHINFIISNIAVTNAVVGDGDVLVGDDGDGACLYVSSVSL